MLDLTQEILSLATISSGHSNQMKGYLIARRKMLWAGYNLAKFQKTVQKTLPNSNHSA